MSMSDEDAKRRLQEQAEARRAKILARQKERLGQISYGDPVPAAAADALRTSSSGAAARAPAQPSAAPEQEAVETAEPSEPDAVAAAGPTGGRSAGVGKPDAEAVAEAMAQLAGALEALQAMGGPAAGAGAAAGTAASSSRPAPRKTPLAPPSQGADVATASPGPSAPAGSTGAAGASQAVAVPILGPEMQAVLRWTALPRVLIPMLVAWLVATGQVDLRLLGLSAVATMVLVQASVVVGLVALLSVLPRSVKAFIMTDAGGPVVLPPSARGLDLTALIPGLRDLTTALYSALAFAGAASQCAAVFLVMYVVAAQVAAGPAAAAGGRAGG